MGWISALAIYFVIWWTVLFAVLPFRLRSQAEEGDIVLGTTHSAPAQHHMLWKAGMTTVLSAVVFALFYVATQVYGLGPSSLPKIIPGT